jgi:surface antigen
MDRLDQNCVGQVLERVPSHETVVWRNPDNAAEYRVVPVRTYRQTSGRYCREYRATAVIDGHEQHSYGTACRQPDGSWQIVN